MRAASANNDLIYFEDVPDTARALDVVPAVVLTPAEAEDIVPPPTPEEAAAAAPPPPSLDEEEEDGHDDPSSPEYPLTDTAIRPWL